jgi:hypothetical protein
MLVQLLKKLTSGALEAYMSSLLYIKSFLITAQLIFQFYLRQRFGAVIVSSIKCLFGEEIETTFLEELADSDTR